MSQGVRWLSRKKERPDLERSDCTPLIRRGRPLGACRWFLAGISAAVLPPTPPLGRRERERGFAAGHLCEPASESRASLSTDLSWLVIFGSDAAPVHASCIYVPSHTSDKPRCTPRDVEKTPRQSERSALGRAGASGKVAQYVRLERFQRLSHGADIERAVIDAADLIADCVG